MTKSDEYRAQLLKLEDWDAYLLQHSGLPGPRGNIELAQVVADLGSPTLFQCYLSYNADRAPTNSPYEFLAFCGVVGLGRLLAEGHTDMLPILRVFASDRRWRTREGVAMALQRLGDVNMDLLVQEMKRWGQGTLLEQRAAAAAVCEPRLLKQARHARAVLELLDQITTGLHSVEDRKSEDFIALRKGLGYCWSVAAAALPSEGKRLLEKWMLDPDKDIRWIMKENLAKNRLVRTDPEWVEKWKSSLNALLKP
jgi:hypothetical protein